MKWNEFGNTGLIDRIFSVCPDVGLIDIFDLQIKRDAKALILTFDLVNELPDKPPVKWGSNFNRCRMGIHCGDIDGLKILGWDYTISAKMSIENKDNIYHVDIKSENVHIVFTCCFLNLTTPSVYLSE